MSRIIATSGVLPANTVSNDQLIAHYQLDSTDEWIQQRTGIQQRHFSKLESESLGDLAAKAVEKLIEQSHLNRQDVTHVIVATMSSGGEMPSIACQVQAKCQLNNAWAFDVSGACSGFVMALDIAEKLTKELASGYTIVVGAEQMSRIINFQDRSSCILFGDGAGAIMIEHDGHGLEGYRSDIRSIPDTHLAITYGQYRHDQTQLVMNGRDVFNFVAKQVIPSLKQFIESHNMTLNYLISHQANQRLLDMMGKKLKLDASMIPSNIAYVANTSAASIPLLLNECVQSNKIKLNGTQTVVLTGFGGGLSYGHISINL